MNGGLKKWAGSTNVFDTETFNNGIAINLSYICFSIGLNLKIPKLEPSEPLKTEPRTSNLLNHQFAPENRSKSKQTEP